MTTLKFIQPADLERETGLSKDLMRKWRARYGFPQPVKLEEGRQGYPQEQIRKLRLIKRLLDSGLRPAPIIGKTITQLEHLISVLAEGQRSVEVSRVTADAISLLQRNDFEGLNELLVRELTRQGLTDFVRDTVAPLTQGLGAAWANGELEVYHEHFCSDALMRLLYGELSFVKPKPGYPRILFGTPPDERHILGMLMAQAVLADQGAQCLGFGSHAPVSQLKKAAQAWHADIVAVSFSFAFPKRGIRPLLAQMRTQLPAEIELWAGGAGVADIKRTVAGVRVFTDLYQPVQALQERVARGS